MKENTCPKKIAFCMTCMNRLYHLQQTLEKNIRDNYLIDEAVFVLLDYNSGDGLEQWVRQNMQSYIDSGILVYYKTYEPEHYFRSHSRNMVFRLANAEIVCNLDADNFLGEGFASFMIEEFKTNECIFYTGNLLTGDTVGRICARKKDFTAINGYDEEIQGYGFEDTDLVIRLEQFGLTRKRFDNPAFYRCVKHSNEERVKDEFMAKNTEKIYISYINPYTSRILLLYKDLTFVHYTLIDSRHLNLYADLTEYENHTLDEKRQIILGKDSQRGKWSKNNDNIILDNGTAGFDREASEFQLQNHTCYAVTDNDFQTEIIFLLTFAINFRVQQQSKGKIVNSRGFGKGVVFENFNENKTIYLS